MNLKPARQLPLATDRLLVVPEGDFPEVAEEVITHIRRGLEAFSDEPEFVKSNETVLIS